MELLVIDLAYTCGKEAIAFTKFIALCKNGLVLCLVKLPSTVTQPRSLP